jgi:predicted unusual protein kinase regulating ubiquinone biosynthesis (AarF/ABC1/UbiB family)
VLELLNGEKVSASHGLPPERASELARELFRFYVRQVMIEGVYHADPHRGNVLLTPDGRLALLDFGLLGRLDDDTRPLSLLLLALLEEDALAVMLEEAEGRLEPRALLSYVYTQLDAVSRLPRSAARLQDLERVLRSAANRVGAALIVVGLLVASALMARVSHTVAFVGFACSFVLGLYMLWKIVRTPGEL